MKRNSLSAVIDMGTSGIRLMVAEKRSSKWYTLESFDNKTSIGKDVFQTENIAEKSLEQVVDILLMYKECLAPWGIAVSKVHCIATAAVRESLNRDMFLERVQLRTGFSFEVLEAMEVNLLTYQAVESALRSKMRLKQSNALIVETSGGGTNVLMLNRGIMVGAHSLSLGSVRFSAELDSGLLINDFVSKYLDQKTKKAVHQLELEFPLSKVRHFIAMGSEIRTIAMQIGEKLDGYYKITAKQCAEIMEKVRSMESLELAGEFGVPYSEAPSFFATLHIYEAFFKESSAKYLIIPKVSIREGVLERSKRSSHLDVFSNEIESSCRSIANKFGVDQKHAKNIQDNALKIFDALSSKFQLNKDLRLYLSAAAIMIEIGRFIHHQHSYVHGLYLVKNSEIFGLTQLDRIMIGLVIRFHGKRSLNYEHEDFRALSSEQRLAVVKLATILKVAHGLDVRLSQRLKVKSVRVAEASSVVYLKMNLKNFSPIELGTLSQASESFAQVFGMKVYFDKDGNDV